MNSVSDDDGAPAVIIGDGWLGRSIARHLDITPIPRRRFTAAEVPHNARVVVASGRAWTPRDEALTASLRSELDHLRDVLEACQRSEAQRIVVLGSCDVAGLAQRIDGSSPQDPRTPYAMVKAALEDECVLWRDAGLSVTVARLAPVHGPGKRRTRTLTRMARAPVIPLPAAEDHSIGFVLLDDAVRATVWLLRADNPPAVVSVGGGNTPLRELIGQLAAVQDRRPLPLRVPLPPRFLLDRLCTSWLPASMHWLVRLAVPRRVEMEPPVDVTPLDVAAKQLVHSP